MANDDSEFERDVPFDSQATDGQMWEVIEIIMEKSKYYKVRWAGFDPQTGKPWKPSWVAKHDCTDDLVAEWNRKKSQKKRHKRNSNARQPGAPRPTVSHTTTTEGSHRLRHSTKKMRHSKSPSAHSTITAQKKRGHSSSIASSLPPNGIVDQTEGDMAPPRPQKRVLPRSFEVQPRNKRRRYDISEGVERVKAQKEEEEEEEETDPHKSSQPHGGPKSNGVRYQKEEEEESSDDDQLEYMTPPPPTHELDLSPVIQENHRHPHEETYTSVPEPNAAYVKYKSGKLSTPNKRREPSESTRAPSSTSDEVEFVAPRRPTTLPESDRLSPWALDRLKQFDAWMQSLPVEEHEEQLEPELLDGGDRRIATEPVHNDQVGFGALPPSNANVRTTRRSETSTQLSPVVTNGAKDDSYRKGIVPETQSLELHSQVPSNPFNQSNPPSLGHGNSGEDNEGEESEPDTQLSQPPIVQHDQAGPSHAKRPALYSTPSRASLISKMKPRTPGSGSYYSVIDEIEGAFTLPEPQLEVYPELDEEEQGNDEELTRSSSRSFQPIPMLSPSAFKPHLAEYSANESGDEHEESIISQFSSPEKGGSRSVSTQRKGKGKTKARIVYADDDDDDDDDGEQDNAVLENVVQERGKLLAGRARVEQERQKREWLGLTNELAKKSFSHVFDATRTSSKGAKRDSKEQLREEEESTQDLLLGQHTLSNEGEMLTEPDPQRQLELQWKALREEEEEATQDFLRRRSLTGADIVRALQLAAQATGRSSQVIDTAQSKHSPKLPARHQSLEPGLALPPTASAPSVPSPSPPDAPAIAQTEPRDYIAILALLNEKSQENAQLMKEIDSLREALASVRSMPKTPDIAHPEELAEARASRDQALASLADSERRVADLARGKGSAEKDVEFFREQYAKASGFVTSVREENKELEEQAQIAKTQAQAGVQMVKATFEARIKALEDDAKMWKRLALFAVEKDARTNDDIRRRAAEEPELRARCRELEEYIDLQDERVKELEREEEQRNDELAKLKEQLSETKDKLGQVVEGAAVKGNELVYRCQWRLEGNTGVCEGLFTSIEELQEHMYSGGHLQV